MQNEDGWKSCHTSFGHIGLHLIGQHERHHFQWHMGPRSLFLWRLDSWPWGWVHSEQQWRVIREELRLNWGTKGKCNGPTDVLSTQAQVRLWCQGEVEIISAWRLGAKKGSRYCEEPSMWKARAQLGGVISHHLGGQYRSIFPRGPRWTCNAMFLECKQPENVLLLMKVSFVICLSIVEIHHASHYYLYKCLNRTLDMLGPLVHICFGEINILWHFYKWLHKTLVIPGPSVHMLWRN